LRRPGARRRPDFQRAAKARHCFLRPVQFEQRGTTAEQRFREIGLDREHSITARGRVGILTEVEAGDSEIDEHTRPVRRQSERFAVKTRGGAQVPALLRRQRGLEQRACLVLA